MIASVNIGCEDLSYLFTSKERRIGSGARSIKNLVYMVVSGLPVRRVCRPVQGHHRLVSSAIGAGEGLWKIGARLRFPTNTTPSDVQGRHWLESAFGMATFSLHEYRLHSKTLLETVFTTSREP